MTAEAMADPTAPPAFALRGAWRTAGNVNGQAAIVRRANPAGDRVAVMPAWTGIELIRDNITAAGKGEIVITALMLVGDVDAASRGLLRRKTPTGWPRPPCWNGDSSPG